MGANRVTKGRALIGRGAYTIVGVATFTWDPGSLIDAAGETKADIAVVGAAFGDRVSIMAPYTLAGIVLTGYVHSAGVCAARLQNESAATVDLVSGSYKAVVERFG